MAPPLLKLDHPYLAGVAPHRPRDAFNTGSASLLVRGTGAPALSATTNTGSDGEVIGEMPFQDHNCRTRQTLASSCSGMKKVRYLSDICTVFVLVNLTVTPPLLNDTSFQVRCSAGLKTCLLPAGMTLASLAKLTNRNKKRHLHGEPHRK